MSPNQRDRLIDALLDGEISEADFLILEAEMRIDSDVRTAYYQRLKLSEALRLEAGSLSDGVASERVSFWRRHARSIFEIGAVAAIIVLVLLGRHFEKSRMAADFVDVEPVAIGYATLAEETDAVWEDSSLVRGDLLPHGPLKLRSGMVQLELFSGVTVFMEGDCAFELKSSMEMTLERGKMRAIVPEAAHGFKVATRNGDVIDLGTEFALDVTSKRSDMVVLQGEIEWHPLVKGKRSLVDGESLRWTAEGAEGKVAQGMKQLPQLGDLRRLFDENRSERRQSWLESSKHLEEDPRLLTYYPMNQSRDWGRELIDESRSELNGAVVSARQAADRWEQAGNALNFSPAGSRVRVVIPGEHRSMTFYCWARIDSLDRMYNSLFLTDGHELNEPHWQIMKDGRLFFSVKRQEAKKGKSDKHIAFSPSFWDPSQSGKWFQIATVYDVDEQTTTHYVNGERISRDEISNDYIVDTVRIGAASIGNWNEPTRNDPTFALRNLNGAIDEFALFKAALSAEEIADLYRKGRP